MQRQDFPIFLHRRIEKHFLEGAVKALNNRASSGARTSLVKVKAHAGEPLNSLADWHASQAVGHDPTLHQRRIEKQFLEGAVKALKNRASSGARFTLVLTY